MTKTPECLAIELDRRFTGNRTHDLIGVSLEDFDTVDELWHRRAHIAYTRRRRRS